MPWTVLKLTLDLHMYIVGLNGLYVHLLYLHHLENNFEKSLIKFQKKVNKKILEHLSVIKYKYNEYVFSFV